MLAIFWYFVKVFTLAPRRTTAVVTKFAHACATNGGVAVTRVPEEVVAAESGPDISGSDYYGGFLRGPKDSSDRAG
ncbi:Alcohol dehydrogenase GroES domain protein [Anopheles sinensis]|uniref:Alcohol dehydrogenase GroES domain protein n=1 Tax=Anopheles sinensis TaxID=74873 RepID=A0A084WAR7_ANOSI|nr:Alcohol dehydrogenase GroES domain protein [Anopheles sinensis]